MESFTAAPGRCPGEFVEGHALDLDVLIDGGIETADACVVSTDGDNTNIVIAQIAQKRFDCPCVVTRCSTPRERRSTPPRPAHRLRDLGRDRDHHAGDLRDARSGG